MYDCQGRKYSRRFHLVRDAAWFPYFSGVHSTRFRIRCPRCPKRHTRRVCRFVSLLVYAGAGQFISVGLWGMGASVFSIVFTTLVVNLRHVLMSAAVAPWFAPFTRIQQFIIGWGLTDEVFATHSMAMAKGEEARLPAVYAVNFTAHGGWILGTFIGAVAGDFLPDPKLFGLDYALPAMFLALLVPQCKDHVYTAAAILSALLSVILALCGIGRWNVIVASVVTSSLGALFLTYRDRCFLCRSKI